jgi:hypothetical protein
MTLYESTEHGFSISYPAGWMKAPATSDPAELITLASAGGGLPGLTVVVAPVGEGITIAEFGPQLSQALSQVWGDYELAFEGEIELGDGTPAYGVVFTGTMGGITLKVKYVAVIRGAQAFSIMGFSTPARFEQDEAALDKVAYSFALLTSPTGIQLDRIVVSPETFTLAPGGVQQFSVKAFDQFSNEIKDFTPRWTVAEGVGRVDENGIFIAGSGAGSYKDAVKVEATYYGASEAAAASVTVSALPSGQTLVFIPTMPAPVPGLGYLIYEDDFSSNLGWSESSQGEPRESYLKDGAYHMKQEPSGGWWVWAPGRSLSQLGDFSLGVTLSRISGPQDSAYGITFNIEDTEQRGSILISPEGKIYFWKNKGPNTYVNSIKVFEGPITTSPGESLDKVRLGVKRHGARWKIFVDGSPVASVSDTAEPLTRLAFYVLGENIHATFDDLAVYASAPPLAPPSAPSGFLVFSDTFDGWNRGWSLGGRGYFQEGALHLASGSKQNSFSYNSDIPKISSFAYQAELSFKDALPQTKGSLVLIKEQGRIDLAIRPTRQIEVSYYSQEDGFNYLIRKTFSGAIKGQGEVNKLLVISRNSSLEFYVNDVFLGSSADPYPDSPVIEVGLYVLGEGSQAAFDNVALHSLSPPPVATLEPSVYIPLWQEANQSLLEFLLLRLEWPALSDEVPVGLSEAHDERRVWFASTVRRLENAIPPQDYIATHRMVLPVYGEMLDRMERVIASLRANDLTEASAQWSVLQMLVEDASWLTEQANTLTGTPTGD